MPMTSATSSCVMPRMFRRSVRFSASILTTSLSVPPLYGAKRKVSTIQTCQKSAFCVRFACADAALFRKAFQYSSAMMSTHLSAMLSPAEEMV